MILIERILVFVLVLNENNVMEIKIPEYKIALCTRVSCPPKSIQ